MRKLKLLILVLMLIVGLTGCLDKIPFIGQLFKSFPAIEGTWDITIRLEDTNCPVDQLGDISLPYEIKGSAEIQRNGEELIIKVYDEQGNLVVQFSGTINKDGEFEISGPLLEDTGVEVDFSIDGTFTDSSVEGTVEATIRHPDYQFSCKATGSFYGTKRE